MRGRETIKVVYDLPIVETAIAVFIVGVLLIGVYFLFKNLREDKK